MSISSPNFEAELRISLKPVLAMLVVLGLAFTFVGHTPSDPSEQFSVVLLALLFYALAGLTWLLDRWRSWVGRWFVIIALVALIHLSNSWLSVPGLLILMVMPTALAGVLISLPAATATAVGETILLVMSPKYGAARADPTTIGVALAAIWAMLGVVCAIYRPARHIARWSWDYYQNAQGLLKEARDRKADLKQALDDLTHANRQLVLANERLAAMRLIAEEAQKTKAAFVAKVSHEFRTPLNMIIGLVDLLVETPEIYGQELPPALLEDLEIVHRNCRHLSGMINDVLDLSRVESGRLALHREQVNLAEIVDGALAVIHPLLEKKHLSLQVIIPDDLPEIYCDRTRIRQVILNLVSNAARFTEEGGITIQVTEQAQRVVVSVADTGPGISMEDAERIFEPFCQGTSRLWRGESGSGLGLSISKQFVELHHGRIWLESNPGVGTTFYFDLPIFAPIEHIARPGHWIREDWVWVERTSRARLPLAPCGPRVVICDETGVLLPAFTRYSDEVEFVETRDLDQAVQEVRRCPAHALVLNIPLLGDLRPLVDRARLEMPHTPVIGCCVPPQTQQASKLGATDYLTKPVTRADLEEAIKGVGKSVRRVLVVDDDPDILQLFTRLLHACDGTLEVVSASSGEQALDKLRNESLDLVLLDIVMPGANGWQVLKLKSQDKAIRDIPVVLVSAQNPAEQPSASEVLLVTMGDGLSLSRLLRCSLEVSALLLKPD